MTPKSGSKDEFTCTTGFPHNIEAVQSGGVEGEFSFKRLGALGSVVLCVLLSAIGPLCVSGGWTKEACVKQLGQLATRLFPFGRRASTPTFDFCIYFKYCDVF